MLQIRIIPCLLLKENGLVKTVQFKDSRYIGDPINAIRIFNKNGVDELILLDIMASRKNTGTIKNNVTLLRLISKISDECFMPMTFGGGIRSLEDIKELLNAGVEKVSINSFALEKPSFIKEASDIFGSQSIVISIDARKQKAGSYEVFTHGGTRSTGFDPVDLAIKMESLGAGEIFINSIDRDGTMTGYDIDLIEKVSTSVNIPVIACGGAGKLEDLADAIKEGKASAAAAGSMFVFHGKRRAVLINFPTKKELESILSPGE